MDMSLNIDPITPDRNHDGNSFFKSFEIHDKSRASPGQNVSMLGAMHTTIPS